MFNFKSFFVKENWLLVKSYDLTLKKSTDKVWFHLFESNKSNRKATIEYNRFKYDDELEELAKNTDLYQETIYRWLKGRINPDIPTYNQVPEEEVIVKLKGKI